MSIPAVSRQRVVTRPSHGVATPHPQVAVPRPAPESGPPPEHITGRYRYDRRSGTWWWSPEMFALHGLPATSAQPDAGELQPVEDRGRILEALARAGTDGRAFALETRIVRPDGQARAVVLVGEPQRDRTGEVAAVEGMCIDITECRPHGSDPDRAQALEVEVGQMRAAMASRAAIEQAKGILMLLTTCGDQVAFDLLAHISSHTHRKVRDVAEVITRSAAGQSRLPDDIRAIIRDACPPTQPLR
ncbi:ANTAR domain-containing protein [Blastococcus mobilis]|uniref:ANTAR domain-containing protein n=1 Tax=Blastococcus mobilis TaxID=1938746 RepID=A0A238VVP4_9ACTN|nr:ANTAR domain-containing protein [Blastococcus mobilis]SNR38346.1 ANTAR domain-containing protein [Blastococcus mobilis]